MGILNAYKSGPRKMYIVTAHSTLYVPQVHCAVRPIRDGVREYTPEGGHAAGLIEKHM